MRLGKGLLQWIREIGHRRGRLIQEFPPLLLVMLAVPGYIKVGEAVTVSVLLTLVLAAFLAFRRRHPVLVFVLVSVAAFAQRSTGEVAIGDAAILVAFYTLASLRSTRLTVAGAVLLECLFALALALWPTEGGWMTSFFLLSGTATIAGVLGVYAQTRAAYLAQLRERTDRLERDRDQQFALAAADERAHIARELHDIVAHHLTVMIALADGAAASVSATPERASNVMSTVSATGRKALADTRLLLGVLHADDVDTQFGPQPDIGELDALLEQVRSAGLPVTMTVTGQRRELAPAMQLTIHRLIQEALTNTLKHAGPGAHACLRVTYTDDDVSVDVRDDGLGSRMAAPSGADPSRHGLNGMRERVAAWDGHLHAGPETPRGWVVSARLPTACTTVKT